MFAPNQNVRAVLATLVVVSLAALPAARSYNVYPAGAAAGNSRTYHIVSGQFPASMVTAIDLAEDQWSAGGGTYDMIRGGNWHFNRGADVSSGYSVGNGRSEIWDRTPSWFVGLGEEAGLLAKTWRNTIECDIVFVEEVTDPEDPDYIDGWDYDWVDAVPSSLSSNQKSERWVTMHEFGHCFGLSHDEDNANTMNPYEHSAGDFGLGVYRIGEDESEAVRELKPHSSTGHNLALSRWVVEAAPSYYPDEAWEDSLGEDLWIAPDGTCGFDIEAISLHSMGTSTLSGVEVRWTLSQNTTCFDGDDIVAATDTHSALSSNEVYPESPGNFCVPTGTAAGEYYVCARVDPDGEVSEVSEADNTVRSERRFTVQ